jgi:hypothetical protein
MGCTSAQTVAGTLSTHKWGHKASAGLSHLNRWVTSPHLNPPRNSVAKGTPDPKNPPQLHAESRILKLRLLPEMQMLQLHCSTTWPGAQNLHETRPRAATKALRISEGSFEDVVWLLPCPEVPKLVAHCNTCLIYLIDSYSGSSPNVPQNCMLFKDFELVQSLAMMNNISQNHEHPIIPWLRIWWLIMMVNYYPSNDDQLRIPGNLHIPTCFTVKFRPFSSNKKASPCRYFTPLKGPTTAASDGSRAATKCCSFSCCPRSTCRS